MIACTNPPPPNVQSDTVVISIGEKASIPVNSTKTGVLYSLVEDVNSEDFSISQFSNGNNVKLVSDVFSEAGTYDMVVKATSLSGEGCESVKPITIHVFALLPVDVLKITGKKINSSNHIEWSVQNEIGFSHYLIERSSDGTVYTGIGSVSAKQLTSYTFIDEAAGAETWYYRLVLVDKHGKKKVSKTVMINGVLKSTVTVRPNPFTSRVNFNFTTEVPGTIRILLYDASGKQVLQKTESVHRGSNNVEVNALDMLRPGLYILRVVQNNKDVLQQKIVK